MKTKRKEKSEQNQQQRKPERAERARKGARSKMINSRARMTDTEAVVVYDPKKGHARDDSLDAGAYLLYFDRQVGPFFLSGVNREDIPGAVSHFLYNQVSPT